MVVENKGNRKYVIDESFFHEINTEEKAYVLGFLCGDGTMSVEKGMVRIVAHPKDIEILYKIRDALRSTHPIQVVDNPGTFSKEGAKIARFNFGRKTIIYDLIKAGFTPRKEYRAPFSHVDPTLRKHLARGLFDADGCIHESKDGSLIATIDGQENLCRDYASWVQGVLPDLVIKVTSGHNCRQVRIQRKSEHPLLLLREMYSEANIYLTRKYNHYLDVEKNWLPSYGLVKLNYETANTIRERLLLGETGASLAREYGVGDSCICAIRKKRCWITPTGGFRGRPSTHKPQTDSDRIDSSKSI